MVGTLSSTEKLLERVFEHLNLAERSLLSISETKNSAQKEEWVARVDDAIRGVWGLAISARPASLDWLMAHRATSVIFVNRVIQAGFELNRLIPSSRTRSVILAELIQAESCVSRFEADLSRYDSYASLVDEHFQIVHEFATVDVLESLARARDAYLSTLSQATLEAYVTAVSDVFSDDRFYYLELPDESKRKLLARASTVFEQLTVGTLVYELVNG